MFSKDAYCINIVKRTFFYIGLKKSLIVSNHRIKVGRRLKIRTFTMAENKSDLQLLVIFWLVAYIKICLKL